LERRRKTKPPKLFFATIKFRFQEHVPEGVAREPTFFPLFCPLFSRF
jgi:hypothetical protein